MKEKIREMILEKGADLCGFASIDRFEGAPEGFKPTDVFYGCKTVISYAVALPRGIIKVSPRLIYGHFNNLSKTEVDFIASESAKMLEEKFDCVAVPLPCDSPYDYWDAENMTGKGLLSMKHAAEQAGLGTLGKSTLFLNERFGNMLTLGAILTDLSLPSDELSESICVEGCRKCIAGCPCGAIGEGTVNQKACRQYSYDVNSRGFDVVICNECRRGCPVCFGKRAEVC